MQYNAIAVFYLRPTKHIIRTFYVSYSLNVSERSNFCRLIFNPSRNEHFAPTVTKMKLNFYSHLISWGFLFLLMPKKKMCSFCFLVAFESFNYRLSIYLSLSLPIPFRSLPLFRYVRCTCFTSLSMGRQGICYKLCSLSFPFYLKLYSLTRQTHQFKRLFYKILCKLCGMCASDNVRGNIQENRGKKTHLPSSFFYSQLP